MELLYLWVEDYKNIKRQGFNFSSKYKFDYDLFDNKIFVEENENYIDGFFGDHILNLTAVVGENGSGKSTLCQFILKQGKGFEIYGEEKEDRTLVLSIELVEQAMPSIESDLKFKLEKRSRAYNMLIDLFNKNYNHIYYSPMFIPDELDQSGSIYLDISTNRLYLKAKSWAPRFLNEESFRQIEFLSALYNNDISETNVIRRRPIKLGFRTWDDHYDKDTEYDEAGDESFADIGEVEIDGLTYNAAIAPSIDSEILEIVKPFYSKESSLDLKLKYYFFIYFIKSLTDNKKEFPFKKIKFPSKDFTVEQITSLKGMKDIDSFIFYFFKIYEIYLTNVTEVEELIKYVKNIKELFDYILKHYKHNYEGNPAYFDTGLPGRYIEIPVEQKTEFQDFMEQFYYKYKETKLNFIIFKWTGLSSGELANLNLQSRFFSIKNNFPKTALIIIDEGELYLHPQWQKEFITNLLTGLKFIFDGKDIQIILTSHSPYIISDLPKDNIIFLKRGTEKDKPIAKDIPAVGNCIVVKGNELVKMERTFGANIHTLLTDSFFMEGGLIGEFAKKKIEEIIHLIENRDEGKKEEIMKIINLIGDELIRRRLKDMYDEAFDAKSFKNDNEYLQWLQDEINRINLKSKK